MQAVPDQPETWCGLRPDLRASWHRSAQYLPNPGTATAPMGIAESDLDEYRRSHPLFPVLSIVERLLVQPAMDAGLILGVGDSQGRLLWVDGDRSTLRRAESCAFLPGALWSEEAIGTSAPGLAIASGHGAQVRGEEHFAVAVHHFSCSATPIHHPASGELLGVLDLTGGPNAVATHAMPLLYAAASAVEAELKSLPHRTGSARLVTLNGGPPEIRGAGGVQTLSLRHAELLVLLGWDAFVRGGGLSASALSEQIFGRTGHEVTLRAEMTRLRRALDAAGLGSIIALRSRPYRLEGRLDFDVVEVFEALNAGERSAALKMYQGPLAVGSEAPGVVELRGRLQASLREAVLSDGSADQLWRYLQLAESVDDEEAVFTALQVLPEDSPRRAALVARMQK